MSFRNQSSVQKRLEFSKWVCKSFIYLYNAFYISLFFSIPDVDDLVIAIQMQHDLESNLAVLAGLAVLAWLARCGQN
jgi:hypothetical protein